MTSTAVPSKSVPKFISKAASGAEPKAAPRGCTNMKLRQLNRRVTAHYDAIVGAAGLKNTQYTLLSHVVLLGPIRPSDLAARMVLDASTLTRNLQPLVALGLLVMAPGADGRSRLVSATAAGIAKRIEMQRLWKQAQLALNARLGEARAAALHEMLDECLALLEDADGSADEASPSEGHRT